MTYRGKVSNGVVRLPPEADLPDGTEVEVKPLPSPEPSSEVTAAQEGPTLAEMFAEFIGVCEGLPEDLAEQHDHYIHGTPKK